MKKPTIIRKRFIPAEEIDISSDELLYRSHELLVTRWKTIRPRLDISGGTSFTFLKEGYKISRMVNSSGEFLQWYCDIIDVVYEEAIDRYMLEDLLLDIVVLPDGTVNVLDADELAEAIEAKLITSEQACRALRNLDRLLKTIYSGNFPPLECSEFLSNI